MKRVADFFGSSATSDTFNLRSAHYVLNKGEVIAKKMAEDIAIHPVVATKITRAFIDAGTVDFKNFVSTHKQGRPFNLYVPNDGFTKAIGEYNDYQASFFAEDLGLDTEEVEENSLAVFAAARSARLSEEAHSLAELSRETRLHPETVRHLSLRSFYLANDTNFNL